MKHYEYEVEYLKKGVKYFYKIFDIVAKSSIGAINKAHSRFIKSMNGDNIFRIKSKSYIVWIANIYILFYKDKGKKRLPCDQHKNLGSAIHLHEAK